MPPMKLYVTRKEFKVLFRRSVSYKGCATSDNRQRIGDAKVRGLAGMIQRSVLSHGRTPMMLIFARAIHYYLDLR